MKQQSVYKCVCARKFSALFLFVYFSTKHIIWAICHTTVFHYCFKFMHTVRIKFSWVKIKLFAATVFVHNEKRETHHSDEPHSRSSVKYLYFVLFLYISLFQERTLTKVKVFTTTLLIIFYTNSVNVIIIIIIITHYNSGTKCNITLPCKGISW